jgi:Cohesin domain
MFFSSVLNRMGLERVGPLVKTETHSIFLALCLILWLIPACVCGGQNNVTVSVEVANGISGSNDFIAKVNISNVTNFDAANYDIIYDPAAFEVTDVTDGLIGNSTIPVAMWRVIKPGSLRIINSIPGLPGVSGSGYLAEIRFHVIGSTGNVSELYLSNGILSNASANEIHATWVGQWVHVYAATTTPPP